MTPCLKRSRACATAGESSLGTIGCCCSVPEHSNHSVASITAASHELAWGICCHAYAHLLTACCSEYQKCSSVDHHLHNASVQIARLRQRRWVHHASPTAIGCHYFHRPPTSCQQEVSVRPSPWPYTSELYNIYIRRRLPLRTDESMSAALYSHADHSKTIHITLKQQRISISQATQHCTTALQHILEQLCTTAALAKLKNAMQH
jgi:hypothetical protein